MNYITQNQSLETNQLTNETQNVINLNVPRTNQPNLLPNMNNNPQNTQTYNPQNTQSYNPQNTQNFNPQNTQTYNPQNTQNFNPQNTQTYNPQNTQTYNPQTTINFNPIITTSPPPQPQPVIQINQTRTFTGPLKLGLESKRINCPHCNQEIDTQIETSMNMKALITAIATLYIGYVLIQICKNKEVTCVDCEHSCPNCKHIIGKYLAM